MLYLIIKTVTNLNTFAKISWMKQGFSSKVVSLTTQPTRESPWQDFNTFTKYCTSFWTNDFSPDEPGYLLDAGCQRTNYHTWPFLLYRERWQLPHHSTFYHSVLPRKAIQRLLFRMCRVKPDNEYMIIKSYSLCFQIEINFRHAKQYWGLEDFMNVEKLLWLIPPIYHY